MDNFEEETPLIFKLIIILIIASALFGTVMGIVNLSLIKLNSKKIDELNTANKTISVQISKIENDIASIDASLKPGGMVDLYINAYHFLSNSKVDLEKIVTLAQGKSKKTFFSLYITGENSVWIGIMSGGKYLFQSEVTPGLSDQRFYVGCLPPVSTVYTLTVDSSAMIMSGSPKNTYILLYTPKGAKIVKMNSRALKVSELVK